MAGTICPYCGRGGERDPEYLNGLTEIVKFTGIPAFNLPPQRLYGKTATFEVCVRSAWRNVWPPSILELQAIDYGLDGGKFHGLQSQNETHQRDILAIPIWRYTEIMKNVSKRDAFERVLSGYDNDLMEAGITEQRLAQKLKQELNAKKSVRVKLKGAVNPNSLPRGIKVMATTGTITENK